MEYITLGNSLSREYIRCRFTTEKIEENDKLYLNDLTKQFIWFSVFLLALLVPLSIFVYGLNAAHNHFNSPENYQIAILISFVLIFIFCQIMFLKKYNRVKKDFEIMTKEVYYATAISSTFYSSNKNSATYFKVKLEGFTIEAIISEKELPQLADSKFIIERLHNTGTIIKIKNVKSNTSN